MRGAAQLAALSAACFLFVLVAYSTVQKPEGTGRSAAQGPGTPSGYRRLNTAGPSAAELEQLEKSYKKWLEHFKAADAAFQGYCLDVLVNSTRFPDKGGQHNQDIFLFMNLFKYWPMQGRKGFYMESGANDAYYLSTSMFFDKCLGWQGLCVEPQPKFHKALRANRSCTLVPECISSKKEVLRMSGTDATAKVTAAGSGLNVTCAPLGDILQRHAGSAQHQVDLWILDVEGFEMPILQGTKLAELNIDAVMVEDLLMLPKPDVLDLVMARNGFLKFQELALDSVFVRRGHPAAASTQAMWYPPGFDREVALKTEHVRSNLCGYLKQAWGATARRRS